MVNNIDNKIKETLLDTVNTLSAPESYALFYREPLHDSLMPSVDALEELVNLLKEVIFPGYFGSSALKKDTMRYYVGVNADKIFRLLSEQIKRGICFSCVGPEDSLCNNCDSKAKELALEFIKRLPAIRHLLSTDVVAAFNGDPAAKSYGEIIFCYPCIKALINHRIAHELIKLDVPMIPRIISEMAHSGTGIDIHPGAQIDESFTIDHGTGVVIGETCIIGKNVKLYQGVTLGAKSFPVDKDGNPIKGIARHPIIEDGVVIYAEATILGRITIGKNSVIGGNVCVMHDLLPNSKVLQAPPKDGKFIDGAGI